ncbi:MAG TPA: type II secretion system F family protein [Solirubrobacterales bacterium]|nr:type II secretion system F family protein [Solirubrobacterales bacterium]
MTTGVILASAAVLLGIAGVAQVLPERAPSRRRSVGSDPSRVVVDSLARWSMLAATDERLGLSARLARAGLADRVSVASLLGAKTGGALAGGLWALVIAPAAPSRLGWIVAAALPATGFLGPDAWLERRARRRLRALRSMLPDALDLLAVGTAAGRSPLAGLTELGAGQGALARELAMLSAETSCGLAQSEALDSLRRRAPVREVAAMCGVIERSRRYGSPLSDQLREQATALRGVQRRRIEERAARAAPKIQLAVALLLVPSVLLMIAAGLLANVDRFMSGF